jgi:hypothetical protein
MTDYLTRITFKELDTSSSEYKFLAVQSENGSNLTSNKDIIIEGTRADGSIVIPGGKKSQRITISGVILADDYKAITDLMNTMKSSVTSEEATLTMEHKEGGSWIQDWEYTVKKIGEIDFESNMRISYQPYSVEFLVLNY